MLLWSTDANESLGGGRREGLFVVPFASRVSAGIVPVAGSLMADSEKINVVNKYLVGNLFHRLTSDCLVSLR